MNPTTEIAVRPNGAEVVRQEFGAVQTAQQHETAAMAVAAQMQALVQAKFIVAMQRPRNVEQFRVRLEAECKRPDFAKLVKYSRPAGKEFDEATGKWVKKNAEGPTIRFVETALQCFGNTDVSTNVIYESEQFRLTRATVMDLERNISYTSDLVITKQIERRGFTENGKSYPPKGREVVSERVNSSGETVYTITATDDETLNRQNNLQSKAIRTNGLRLLPRDIVDRCMKLAEEVVAKHDAADPEAAKRNVIDSFNSVGVEPVDLEAYLGKPLSKPLTPPEIADLRKLFVAVVNGEATWAEIMASKDQTGSAEQQEALRQQKIAEAEAKLAAQKGQQTEQPQDEEPKREMNTTGFAPEPEAPKQTEQKAPDAPEVRKPVFGRRNQ